MTYQTEAVLREQIADLQRQKEALLDALIMALPYVESALEDKGYKPGAVDKALKPMRDIIARAEGARP